MITLTTDFGNDFYVAQIKGIVLSLNKDERIIDITHNIEKYNILNGAFVLSQVWRYFPKGTIHLGVVDPGVGGSRRGIIIETEYCYFVGPDNGLFALAINGQKINPKFREFRSFDFLLENRIKRIIEINIKKFASASKTFHGRDVFAPVAALLSKGEDAEKFGKSITDIKKIEIEKDRIIYIDSFGNIITTVPCNFKFGDDVVVNYKNRKIKTKFIETFGNIPVGKFLVLRGSHGFIEIDINQGNAAEKLGAKIGDVIKILRSR